MQHYWKLLIHTSDRMLSLLHGQTHPAFSVGTNHFLWCDWCKKQPTILVTCNLRIYWRSADPLHLCVGSENMTTRTLSVVWSDCMNPGLLMKLFNSQCATCTWSEFQHVSSSPSNMKLFPNCLTSLFNTELTLWGDKWTSTVTDQIVFCHWLNLLV